MGRWGACPAVLESSSCPSVAGPAACAAFMPSWPSTCVASVSSVLGPAAQQTSGRVDSGAFPTAFLARGSPAGRPPTWHRLCLFLPSLGRAWGRLPLQTLDSRRLQVSGGQAGEGPGAAGSRPRNLALKCCSLTAVGPWGHARMEANTPRTTGRGSGVSWALVRILASWHQTWHPGDILVASCHQHSCAWALESGSPPPPLPAGLNLSSLAA